MNLMEKAVGTLRDAGLRAEYYGKRRSAMPVSRYVAVSRGKTERIGNGPAARVVIGLLACVPVAEYPSMPEFLDAIRAAMSAEPSLAFTGRIGETRSEQALGICTMELEYVGIEDAQDADPDGENDGGDGEEGEGENE